jgi:hypothetical protein
MSAQLLGYADTGRRSFEVDIDQRDVRPLAARQLQRFARRVRRPEDGKTSLLEHRRGTVGNDCLIFDHQYDHHTFASSQPSTKTSNKRRRGFLPRGAMSANYRSSVSRLLAAELRLSCECAR